MNYFFYLRAVNPFGTSEQSEAALISTKGRQSIPDAKTMGWKGRVAKHLSLDIIPEIPNMVVTKLLKFLSC